MRRASVRVEESIPFYLEAIELARRTGANFVEGVASVALASARTRIGDVAGAADGFAYLLDYWQQTGQQTQLWTTARNAASLLASVGHRREAALLLLSADATPAAAAVGPAIARHSGRAFLPVEELADPDMLDDLRAEARRLTPGACWGWPRPGSRG